MCRPHYRALESYVVSFSNNNKADETERIGEVSVVKVVVVVVVLLPSMIFLSRCR